MKQLTPKQIVKELNRYIIGQTSAKKGGCNCFEKSLEKAAG